MTICKCTYGAHLYDTQITGTGYVYTDLGNGVDEDTDICPPCYLAHLQRYWPASPLTIHLTLDWPQHKPGFGVRT